MCMLPRVSNSSPKNTQSSNANAPSINNRNVGCKDEPGDRMFPSKPLTLSSESDGRSFEVVVITPVNRGTAANQVFHLCMRVCVSPPMAKEQSCKFSRRPSALHSTVVSAAQFMRSTSGFQTDHPSQPLSENLGLPLHWRLFIVYSSTYMSCEPSMVMPLQ